MAEEVKRRRRRGRPPGTRNKKHIKTTGQIGDQLLMVLRAFPQDMQVGGVVKTLEVLAG